MFKYIIFDFDGTLADSKGVFISAYNQIAAKRSYQQIASDNLQYLRRLTIAERCKYLNVPMYRIPSLATEFLSIYKSDIQQVKLFEGIKELLSGLDNIGLQTAIISSNARQNITRFLFSNNVESISEIYCRASLFGKDRLIAKFLKKQNLGAHQVLYVGDEIRDIVACQKVGVKIAWVEWGYDTIETAAATKPDYLVASPREILNIVNVVHHL